MPIGEGWHSIGRDDAPATLVEFADYQCPFCRRFQAETFAQLKKNFIDPGKLRFISRDLPLDFHANALGAAEAARCAGDQGKYWEMRDALTSGTSGLSHEAIIRYAESLSMDRESFGGCLDGETHKTAIQKDLVDAQMLKISGTPTFILGKTDKEAIDGVRIVGAQPYSTFEAAIRRLLSDVSPHREVPTDR
jgi:protein-disulfide isomerase